jgi:hypothetical protein
MEKCNDGQDEFHNQESNVITNWAPHITQSHFCEMGLQN